MQVESTAGSRRGLGMDLVFLVVIVVLVAGPLLYGLRKLNFRGLPVERTENVGFVPPRPASPGARTALGMAIEVQSCHQPVEVTVVAAATANYWRKHAGRIPETSRFMFVIPDRRLHDPKLSPGTLPSDLTGPLYATSEEEPFGFRQLKPEVHKSVTALAGTYQYWDLTEAPVIARFKANWLKERGVGSCYLLAPGLVGPFSVFAAQLALGNTLSNDQRGENQRYTSVVYDRHLKTGVLYDRGLEPTHGSTTVLVHDGFVDTGASLPNPDTQFDGHPKWTCSSQPLVTKRLRSSGPIPDIALANPDSIGAFSERALGREEASNNCAAVIVITEDGSATKRDLLLLGMGTLISLGLAIAVEIFLEWRRRRSERAHDRGLAGAG